MVSVNNPRALVWMDMDPGIDDSWALVIAGARANLLGVSAVGGNVPLTMTYGNARQVLQTMNRADVPVIPGADNPLLAPLITATGIHGRSGMGDWQSSPVLVVNDQPRVWEWWNTHREDLADAHLIATGPLTNLAVAFLAYPGLRDAWRSMTLMVGALPGTQVDKPQEFNLYVDPHGADVVLHWGERVKILGINVAHRAVMPLSDLGRLQRYGAVGAMLSQMLGFYSQRARGEGGDPNAFPIDDVTALAASLRPDLFTWTEMPLAVVREGPLRGTLVVSPIDLKRRPISVAVDVDTRALRDWVWESMEQYTV